MSVASRTHTSGASGRYGVCPASRPCRTSSTTGVSDDGPTETSSHTISPSWRPNSGVVCACPSVCGATLVTSRRPKDWPFLLCVVYTTELLGFVSEHTRCLFSVPNKDEYNLCYVSALRQVERLLRWLVMVGFLLFTEWVLMRLFITVSILMLSQVPKDA